MSQNINCLYIPNTFGVDAEYIQFIFELDYCKIDNIQLFGKYNTNGHPYTSARVYVREWYDNTISANFIKRITNNNNARIIYDNCNEHYWNVMLNKTRVSRHERVNLYAQSIPVVEQSDNVMLTNSDFAAMYPPTDDFEDAEFKNACRELIIEDDEVLSNKMYVKNLENVVMEQCRQIEDLTHELERIKKML